MLRKNSYSESEPKKPDNQPSSEELVIQDRLQQLEEFIVNSNNIPLTPYKFVNEEQFFDQMDQLWRSLPESLEEADFILQEKEDILKQARLEREQLLQQAQQEAEEIKNQTRIVQQARQEAAQIQAEAQQESEELHQVTLQEIEKLRQQASAECEQLRSDADDYAYKVLMDLEERLGQMLSVTRNGRASLNPSPETESPKKRQKPKRKAS